MSTNSHNEDTSRLPVTRTQSRPQPLVAEVVSTDSHGLECTIFPEDAEGLDLMTRWITADEGAFVALEDVR